MKQTMAVIPVEVAKIPKVCTLWAEIHPGGGGGGGGT